MKLGELFFSLPVGARPAGEDADGRPVYRGLRGETYRSDYRVPVRPDDYALRRHADEVIADEQGWRERPDPVGNALANLPGAIGNALLEGISAPGNALRGETVTNGDAFATALNAMGAAPLGMAPEGALLAGPMRVAHGSPTHGLTELRPSARGALGPGVYGTPSRNVARQYAGDEGAVYEFTADNYFNGLGRHGLGPDDNPYQVWRDETARVVAAAPEALRPEVERIISRLGPDDGYRLHYDLARLTGSDEAAQDLFRRAGFSGMSGHADGPELVMFDPVRLDPDRNALAAYLAGVR